MATNIKSVFVSILLTTAGLAFAATAAVAGGDSAATAIAVLHPTEGNTATGIVRLEQTAGGVKVTASLEGLTAGKHGFHIHAYGDCSGRDGKTAGGHFNPDGTSHGGPADRERHVGDLGNILVGNDGKTNVSILDPRVKLSGPGSVIGRAIVVHGGEDDLKSQPSGAAGPRVACGVIGVGKN